MPGKGNQDRNSRHWRQLVDSAEEKRTRKNKRFKKLDVEEEDETRVEKRSGLKRERNKSPFWY